MRKTVSRLFFLKFFQEKIRKLKNFYSGNSNYDLFYPFNYDLF